MAPMQFLLSFFKRFWFYLRYKTQVGTSIMKRRTCSYPSLYIANNLIFQKILDHSISFGRSWCASQTWYSSLLFLHAKRHFFPWNDLHNLQILQQNIDLQKTTCGDYRLVIPLFFFFIQTDASFHEMTYTIFTILKQNIRFIKNYMHRIPPLLELIYYILDVLMSFQSNFCKLYTFLKTKHLRSNSLNNLYMVFFHSKAHSGSSFPKV